MNWGNIDLYYFIFLLPLAILLGMYHRNNKLKQMASFADPEILKMISADNDSTVKSKSLTYSYLLLAIFLLLLISILRPQWGFVLNESKREGLDIVVAIDLSESMLATDISPSRLDRAKREVTDLLQALKGDRIALVTFAGVAFIDSPLTLDYKAFNLFLDTLNTSDIPIQGTNIEAALDKSMEALGLLDKDRQRISSTVNRDRAIILITDGEELQGSYQNAVKIAKENNVRIYILGIGTTFGGPINIGKGFKKDKDGKLIITKLNEEVLKQLSLETGGIYIPSQSSQEDTALIYTKGIKLVLKDATLVVTDNKSWNEYFQYPLLLAILLICTKLWRGNGYVYFLLLSLFIPNYAFADDIEKLGAAASRHYKEGKYSEASEEFQKAQKIAKDDYRLYLGSGSSLYREKKFEEAQREFYDAASKTNSNILKSTALFNAGNALVQQSKYEDSLKTYEESLKLNPEDQQIKDNIEYVKKLIQQQKMEDKQKKKEDNKDKKEQEQKSDNSESNDKESKSNQNNSEDWEKEQNTENAKDQNKSDQQHNDNQNSSDENKKPKDDTKDNSDQKSQETQREKDQGSDSENETKDDQQAGNSHSKNQLDMNEETNPILNSIEEKSENRDKYRLKKSLEQLKNYGLTKSDIEKNW